MKLILRSDSPEVRILDGVEEVLLYDIDGNQLWVNAKSHKTMNDLREVFNIPSSITGKIIPLWRKENVK